MRLLPQKSVVYSIEPYILTGYRPILSFIECLQSLFYLHNQSINIWTSIVLILMNIGLVFIFTQNESNMPIHIYLLFWFQGGLRAFCWFNSWAYHTFVCRSKLIATFWCRLDYIGCYLTPLGMGTTLLYLELSCSPIYASLVLFIGFIGVILSIMVSCMPIYQTESYRTIRLILSFCTCIPYLIGLILAIYITHKGVIPDYYNYLLYAFIFELFAAFFYVSMLPEILIPRLFDLCLPSHSLWHWFNFGFDIYMMYLSYYAYKRQEFETC